MNPSQTERINLKALSETAKNKAHQIICDFERKKEYHGYELRRLHMQTKIAARIQEALDENKNASIKM